MKIYVSCHAAHLEKAKRVEKRFATRRIKATTVPLGSSVVPFARTRVEFRVGSIMRVAIAEADEIQPDKHSESDLIRVSKIAIEAKSILEDLFPMLSVIQTDSAAASIDSPGNVVEEAQVTRFAQQNQAPEQDSGHLFDEILQSRDGFQDDDPLDVLCNILADDFVEKLGLSSDDNSAPSLVPADKALIREINAIDSERARSDGTQQQFRDQYRLDSRFTFDEFVTGPSNIAAFDTLHDLLDHLPARMRSAESVLCLHSREGLGKTHLAHAASWAARRSKKNISSIYVTAAKFSECILDHENEELWMSPDLLLIDDIDTLDGSEPIDCFKELINRRAGLSRPTLVTSTHLPPDLLWLSDLAPKWQYVEIGRLEHETRLEIARRAVAQRRKIDSRFYIYEDALEHLVEICGNSGRDLESAVARAFSHWTRSGKPLTSDDVLMAIAQPSEKKQPEVKLKDILKIVSARYAISERDLLSGSPSGQPAKPAQVAVYLANQLTSLPLPEIGFHFGRMNHVTVRACIERMQAEIARDLALGEKIMSMKNAIWTALSAVPQVPKVAMLALQPAYGPAGRAITPEPAITPGLQPPQRRTAAMLQPRVTGKSRPGAWPNAVPSDTFEGEGTLKWFDIGKGYGFVEHDCDLPDALLHIGPLLAGGHRVVHQGTRIRSLLRYGANGLKVVSVLDLDPYGVALNAPTFDLSASPESKWDRAVVKWFNWADGFGFLTRGPGTPDIYFHKRVVRLAGLTGVSADQELEVQWVRGKKGCIAEALRPLCGDDPGARSGRD